MTDIQKMQLRLAELRQFINNWTGAGDDPELQERQAEYNSTNDELIAAIKADAEAAQERLAEAQATPIEMASAEDREFNNLANRIMLENYLLAAEQHRLDSGAEYEFNQALFGEATTKRAGSTHAGSVSMPWHALLDNPYGNMEFRVDAVTTVDATTGVRSTHPILDRIFSREDMMYLGAQTRMVGAGTQSFPYLSTGVTVGYHDENEEHDATKAVVSVEDVDPEEGQAAFVLGMTSKDLRFGSGVVEAAIRRDVGKAIPFEINRAALLGASGHIEGLYEKLTPPQNATATLTATDFLKIYSSRVDGKYAYTSSEVRTMVRPSVYQFVEFLEISTGSGRFVGADMLGPDRLRASNTTPADSSGLSQVLSYAPMGNQGDWVVPMWADIIATVDPYSLRAKRQTRYTFDFANNNIIIRTPAWQLHSVKLT